MTGMETNAVILIHSLPNGYEIHLLVSRKYHFNLETERLKHILDPPGCSATETFIALNPGYVDVGSVNTVDPDFPWKFKELVEYAVSLGEVRVAVEGEDF